MLLLDDNSELRVVTSAAVTVDVHASYVDNDAGTTNPVPVNTAITTATTTSVVGSPAAGDQRNVQTLIIRNKHASSTNTITVRHDDGTVAADLFGVALGPGETCQYLDGVGWQVLTNGGAIKTAQNQGNNPISSVKSVVVLGSDVTNNNATANTIADVTGLSFPVTSGKKYWFRFQIQYTAAATTTGSRWSISGPGASAMRYASNYALTATSETINNGLTAHDLPAASNATSAATAGNTATIEGFYEASANGNVIARFASEISSSAIVAKAGSIVEYLEVL